MNNIECFSLDSFFLDYEKNHLLIADTLVHRFFSISSLEKFSIIQKGTFFMQGEDPENFWQDSAMANVFI
jgi:hypothetical protein